MSALPWELRNRSFATLKELPRDVIVAVDVSRTLSEFLKGMGPLTQGVALGWNLRTPSAFNRE